MRRDCWLVLAAAASFGCTLSSGDDGAARCALVSERAAIVGGELGSTLPAARRRALARLSIPGLPGSTMDCTAVVVGPGVAVSAKHCLDHDANGVWDGSARNAELLDESATVLGQVEEVRLHPELDVAAFHSSSLLTAATGIVALPFLGDTIDQAWVGASVELAGFGVSEHDEPPTLRFAVETVESVAVDHVVVDGRGASGACAGDSGGPLLVRTNDGNVRVLGLLDDGDPSCLGLDRYTRADRLRGWEPLGEAAFHDAPPAAADCAAL